MKENRVGRWTFFRLTKPKENVSALNRFLCPIHADLLDRVIAFPKPGRVDKQERKAAKLDRIFDEIARRTGYRGGDRRLFPDYCVEKCRLSRIWRPSEHYSYTIAEPLSRRRTQHLRHFLAQSNDCAGAPAIVIGNVILVRKINPRFDRRSDIDQFGPPLADRPRQRTIGQCHCIAPLTLRFGEKKIAQTLRLGEIDAAIGEGASCKFSR